MKTGVPRFIATTGVGVVDRWLGSNPRRTTLIIFPPDIGTVYISDNSSFTGGQGLIMNSTGSAVILKYG